MPSKSIYEAKSLELVFENGIYNLRRNGNSRGGRRYKSDRAVVNLAKNIAKDYREGKFCDSFTFKMPEKIKQKAGLEYLANEL